MAKSNTLRLAVVVAAAVVVALLLVTVNHARAATVSEWAQVKEITGTISWNYDQDHTRTYAGGGSDTVRKHISLKTTKVVLNHKKDSLFWSDGGSGIPATLTYEAEWIDRDSNGKVVSHGVVRPTTWTENVGSSVMINSSSVSRRPEGTYEVNSISSEKSTPLPREDLVTGHKDTVEPFVNTSGSLPQPLPAAGFTLSGSTTTGTVNSDHGRNILTWDLKGPPAKQTNQIKVTAKKKFISPNEEVTFKALDQKGNPVNAKWSGGGTPKTHTGTTFTTRYNVSPGFQGLDETVTARAVKGGATAKGEVKVLKPSGTAWVGQYPGDNRIAALDAGFQANVQDFDDALANAGAARDIAAVYRPPERAHLMFYARKIAVDGMAPRKVPTPNCTIKKTTDGPIYVAWAHYNKKDGTYDKSGSVAAAKKMLAPTRQGGYGIGKNPVAHPSRHELRLAIDWNITWNGNLRIAWGPNGGPNGEQAGTIDKITTTPHTGLNQELWKVGASYGVIKFESVNRTKDPPHWSDNGH